MDFLLENPYFHLALVVGGVVLVLRAVSNTGVMKGRGPNVDSLMGALFGSTYRDARLKRDVAHLSSSGHHLAAGQMLESAGRPQEAVEVYIEGSEHYAAASTLEKLGNKEKAAELYLLAGDTKKSAQVFESAGKPGRAAAMFLERGNTLEAARLFAVAGQWEKAAELYAKGGYPLRAAEAWERKGDFTKAAEAHERNFMENVSYSTSYSSTAPSPDQKSALTAGRLYEKAGDLPKAQAIYQKGGYFKEAAATAMSLGQFAKAAEWYTRADDSDAAAAAFEKAGDTVHAANLRGEIALKQEKIAEAASFFQKGEDYLRAAELFESIGMLKEAAGAFEAGYSWSAAGNVYVRAGDKARAAGSYEKGGEYETAARLYEEAGLDVKAIELFEKAGFTFKSGEAAARAGENDRAITLLQRVPANDENYRTASEILARLFVESGRPALAVDRVQKVLAGQGASSSNLDLHYWLAVAYEASNHPREALEVYKKIQSEDLAHRDVSARVAKLQAGGRTPPPTPGRAAAGPVPAAPGAAAPAAVPGPYTLQELQRRGVATLRTCTTCGRCFDHHTAACPEDHTPLAEKRVLPYVLGDRYRLVRVLGEGGMGTVFHAHDGRLDRNVALKIVNAEQFKDPQMRSRLGREARTVARIQHPGVVALHDSGELEDGSAFLVMEMLDGCDLARLMRAYGRGRPAQVVDVLRQTASAVVAAHRAGIVHRDLKPQNIFICNEDGRYRVKVLDFGIAKVTAVEGGLTATGSLLGTPAYMSPEQVKGGTVDPRSDLYSLATLGWEALSGDRLVPEGDVMTMLFAVMNNPAPKLSSRVPGVPAAVDEAFTRALAKDPQKRPSDPEAWVGSFAAALGGVVIEGLAGWPEPLPAGIPGSRIRTAGRHAPAGDPPAPSPTVLASAPTAGARPPAAAPARPAGARFTKKEELGQGPLGRVFRAEDSADGRSVALRVMPREITGKDALLRELTADLKAIAKLSHPNGVKVLGFLDVDGERCVVTEYVSGRNFADALKSGHRMTVSQVHSLGRVLAQFLAAVHAQGLAHGSIQPSNIMVAGGVVKIADLGLGRARFALGDERYGPPEVEFDASGDLYCMACVLYHLLTGVHPKSQAQGAALPLPSTLAPGVPEALDKLLLKALHPRREVRPQSADEVLHELKDMMRIV